MPYQYRIVLYKYGSTNREEVIVNSTELNRPCSMYRSPLGAERSTWAFISHTRFYLVSY